MALFTLRRAATGEPGGELSAKQRAGLPHRFEALAEALASGTDSIEVCLHLGAQLAQDGVPLAEALDRLRVTSLTVLDQEPSFAEVSAIGTGWSESMLGYLHGLSCEDPLTGLASLAHVRARLSELNRGELRQRVTPGQRHALVVVELAWEPGDDLAHQLRLARVANAARTVFVGEETIGRAAEHRVVVIADRDRHLGRRLGLMRTLLGHGGLGDHDVRVWIEALPATDEATGRVLDELTRH